jgi:hypothetical protein
MAGNHIASDGRAQSSQPATCDETQDLRAFDFQTVDAAALHLPWGESSVPPGKPLQRAQSAGLRSPGASIRSGRFSGQPRFNATGSPVCGTFGYRTSTSPTKELFTGQQRDNESGLDYKSIVTWKSFFPFPESEDSSPPRCSAKLHKLSRLEITMPCPAMRVRLQLHGKAERKR